MCSEHSKTPKKSDQDIHLIAFLFEYLMKSIFIQLDHKTNKNPLQIDANIALPPKSSLKLLRSLQDAQKNVIQNVYFMIYLFRYFMKSITPRRPQKCDQKCLFYDIPF